MSTTISGRLRYPTIDYIAYTMQILHTRPTAYSFRSSVRAGFMRRRPAHPADSLQLPFLGSSRFHEAAA
jgi:hypothetical protein